MKMAQFLLDYIEYIIGIMNIDLTLEEAFQRFIISIKNFKKLIY